EIRETKLEEEKDEIVPDYMKPETRLATDFYKINSQNVWSEAVNMDTTNQKEAIVNTATNIEQATSSSASSSLTIEQELHDKLMMDDPFSKQHLEKDTSTRSSDIVMKTTENEAEFTIVINKKKKKVKYE
ncbi:46229_t:CDS:2, partial [Gigaspora margarita]